MQEHVHFGEVDVPKEAYDKLETVVITMNADGIRSESELIRYLSLLLNREMPRDERVAVLRNEYHIQVDEALEEDVSRMCNYSDAILRIGKNEGRTEGKLETLKDLVKDGFISIKEAARRADLSVEDFSKETGIEASKIH